MITCQTAQMLEALAEEKKINAIGFTKQLNEENHFVVV